MIKKAVILLNSDQAANNATPITAIMEDASTSKPLMSMRKALKLQWKHSYVFGISVYLLSLVPLINLLIMPVAVCGATAMWVDKFRAALRLPE